MSPTAESAAAPRVTVVTVVFDGAAEIDRTIASVRAQDCAGVELVVVDGGSRDGTPDAVRRHGAAVDRFVSEPDRGVYDAMNKGAALATGEFLLFMNCGDRFASPQALSALLAAAVPGEEQVLFGGWIRRGDPGGERRCAPDLARGRFNHQAVAYSRSIHRWHGPYAVVPGLTTADYLFFATLMASRRVPCRVVDATVASIDVHGASAGLQTYGQKLATDYLCGRIGRLRLAIGLIAHPLYFHAKRCLRWIR